jgi:hypothetical protein
MPAALDRASNRNWADLLAIVTAVSLIGISIWPGTPSASIGADRETTATPALWLAHIASGSLAIIAVFIGQKWRNRPLARLLLVGGAIVLLGALLVFRDFTTRALLTTIVPALALLVSAVAIGPMPREVTS